MSNERFFQAASRFARVALFGLATVSFLGGDCEPKEPPFFGRVGSPVGLTDINGPLITNFLPVPNVTLNDVAVMATITDPVGTNGAAATGVDPASVTATGDDGADLAITTSGTNMYNADIANWGDGLHTIQWKAFDFAGNEGTATQSIEIDRTDPVVTVNPIPPASATSDDATFSWTVGVNIVDPNFFDATYTVRFAGQDQECGTSDDVTPTPQQVPTSTFELEEGSNSIEVVVNNGVQPGGQPTTAIYCGGVFARDDAVTKTGSAAPNTTSSIQYRTELLWQPPSGSGDFIVVFTQLVTDHRGQTSVICWVAGTTPAQPGATLQVVTTGPGVLTPTVNRTLNAGGMAAVEVGINLFGTYNLMQTVTSGSNQASASTTHTVGVNEATCPEVQSSIRFKQGVTALLPDDARPLGLRPVAFRYTEPWGDPAEPRIGLIAEEVAEVFPAAVFLDAEGRPESIHYGILTRAVVDELEARAANAARSAIARLAEAF